MSSSINKNNKNLNSSNNSNSSSNDSNNRSKCNLIVNYLPQSLKEQDFRQLFGKIGAIRTCKLMHDKQTGYSFGYGFVDYQNADDAKKAIDTFNGYQLEHKRLKVAYARPNSDDTKNTNLYVRNIPSTYDEIQLEELFSKQGDVVQVRILRDPNTTFSRRIGFVIMATHQMAQTAITNLDNQTPENATEPIHVKFADEEGKKRQAPRNLNAAFNVNSYGMNTQNGNLYTSFQTTTNDSHMQHSILQNYGKMKSRGNSQNRYNPMSSNSFGFFSNQNATSNGYDSLFNNPYMQPNQNYFNSNYNTNYRNNNFNNGSLMSNQSLDQNKSGHIIYVYGIGPNANESDLYTLFQNVGRILRVNVIKNQKSGAGKGYGFVVFESYEEACYAVQQLNGFIFNNRPLQVQLHTSTSRVKS